MSYGSEAASAAADTGSNAVPAASAAGSGAGGFAMDLGQTGTAAPTDGTYVSLTPMQQADVSSYGTSNPSMWDKAVGTIDRFNKGGNQNLPEAWKNFGNNPETYGYVSNKLAGLTRGAGGGQSAPASVNTTVNYQQPSNPYLERRRRY